MASKTKPTKTKPEFQILALVVMSKLYVHPKKHYGQENLGKPNQTNKKNVQNLLGLAFIPSS